MRAVRLLPLLLAMGCGTLAYYSDDPEAPGTPGTDEDTPTDSVGDTDEPGTPPDTDEPTTPPPTDTGEPPTTPGTTPPAPTPIALGTVEPDYGSNAGGTELTLTGTFDLATEVYVDGTRATVTSGTATELVADSPASSSTGWVDVEVRSGTQSDTLPGAFQYWADDSGGSGTMGWLAYLDMVGGYWTGGPVDDAFGAFAFTSGSNWQLWRDYTSAIGTCVYDHPVSALPTGVVTGAANVQFTAPGGVTSRLLDATAGIGPGWYARDLTPSVEVVPGATYDMDPVAGGPDWPGFGLTGAIQVPPAFAVTTPNLGAANLQNQARTINMVWNGAATADYVVIWIERQWDNGGIWQVDGHVTCAVPDTGSFTIPQNLWPYWVAGDLLHVQVARVYEGNGVLPHNNADHNAVGLYWVYGALVCN